MTIGAVVVVTLRLPLSGDDITSIQQEITMMKECKHKNIVAYLGTYHRCVPFISGLS